MEETHVVRLTFFYFISKLIRCNGPTNGAEWIQKSVLSGLDLKVHDDKKERRFKFHKFFIRIFEMTRPESRSVDSTVSLF